MANIKKIMLPGSEEAYDIVDAGARQLISELQEYTEYLGVTTTAIEDGDNTNPIEIGGEEVTAKKGNIVNYGSKEFIWNGLIWQEFGDLSGLGDLAFADSASTSYTPAGTVSTPDIDITGVTAELAAAPTIDITGVTAALDSAPTVTIGGQATASKPDITVTPTKTTIDELDSVGSLPQVVMPTMSVENEVLTFTPGSYVAGSLPTKKQTTEVLTDASAALNSAPIVDLTNVTATASAPSISVAGTATANKPAVNISGTATATQPTFAGTTASIEVTPTV